MLSVRESAELEGLFAFRLLQFTVDAQLDASNRQQADPGFRPARLDLVADPELPFPDPRRRRRRDHVIHALVIHGRSPPRLELDTLTATPRLHLFNFARF